MEEEMEEGWKEKVDNRSGRTFYFNRKLKQTSWKKPLKGADKGTWEERIDEDGEVFYYNATRKIRSYTKPEVMVKKKNRRRTSMVEMSTKQPMKRQSSVTLRSVRSSLPSGHGFNSPFGATHNYRQQSMVSAVSRQTSVIQEARASRRRSSVRLGETLSRVPIEDKFKKLRDLRQATQGVKHLKRDSTTINLEALSNKLVPQKKQYNILEYAKENFRLTKKSMLGKAQQLSVMTMTKWHDIPLSQSLHGFRNSWESRCVSANKDIMAFMGDAKMKKKDTERECLLRILHMGITEDPPEDVRDELYCQILKQVTENPTEDSTVKGWKLFAICAGTFPPSLSLEPYLVSFFESNADACFYGEAKKFAKYALLRLRKSIESGARQLAPCNREIDCILERKPITIDVYLVSNAKLRFEVECWTTGAELKENVTEAIGVLDDKPFAVIEISNTNKEELERVIEDDEKILDVVAFWESEGKFDKAMVLEDADETPARKFVYKMRLFLEIKRTDNMAVELAYYQAVHDISDSKYPVTELDLAKLISLEAQSTFGSYDGSDQHLEDFEQYLPSSFSASEEKILQLGRLVTAQYEQLDGVSKYDAKLRYLEHANSWPLYGAQVFFVKPLNNPALGKVALLAVNNKGVMVIDPKTKDIKSSMEWSTIMNWGDTKDTVCIVLGNYLAQTKLWFKVSNRDDFEVLYSLITAYGDLHRKG